MALNHVNLMKDLERLDDLLILARNILTAHKCAQDFAGETGLDKQVFKLIGLCIRVTAQGYDGDPASRNETIWANIVQLCKLRYSGMLLQSIKSVLCPAKPDHITDSS